MLARLSEIYREGGFWSVFQAIPRFLRWRYRGLRARIKYNISDGKLTRSIDGTVVTFTAVSYPVFYRCYTFMGEKEIISDLLVELQPDDVVFDIGANVGVYSCFAGKYLTDGHVVAFEPYPPNVQPLRQNLEQNVSSFELIEKALADSSGTATLSGHASESGEGEHSLATGENETEHVRINVVRGDELVNEGFVPQPSIIKIDVEGTEHDVVKGMRDTLADPDCRVLYCEVHPERMETFGSTYDELLKELSQIGFKIESVNVREGEYHIKGVK